MSDGFNDKELRAWAERQARRAPTPTPQRAQKISNAMQGRGTVLDEIPREVIERAAARILAASHTDERGCINHRLAPVRTSDSGRDYFTLRLQFNGERYGAVSPIRIVYAAQTGQLLGPDEILWNLCGNDRCLTVGHFEKRNRLGYKAGA